MEDANSRRSSFSTESARKDSGKFFTSINNAQRLGIQIVFGSTESILKSNLEKKMLQDMLIAYSKTAESTSNYLDIVKVFFTEHGIDMVSDVDDRSGSVLYCETNTLYKDGETLYQKNFTKFASQNLYYGDFHDKVNTKCPSWKFPDEGETKIQSGGKPDSLSTVAPLLLEFKQKRPGQGGQSNGGVTADVYDGLSQSIDRITLESYLHIFYKRIFVILITGSSAWSLTYVRQEKSQRLYIHRLIPNIKIEKKGATDEAKNLYAKELDKIIVDVCSRINISCMYV